MTEKYQPIVGDRVRLVVEGEIGKVDLLGSGVWLKGFTTSWIGSDHTVSIEKIEEPFPVGMVLWYQHISSPVNSIIVRQPEGWRFASVEGEHAPTMWTDAEARSFLRSGAWVKERDWS